MNALVGISDPGCAWMSMAVRVITAAGIRSKAMAEMLNALSGPCDFWTI